MKYLFYIALVVLAILSFPSVLRQLQYSRDTQSVRELLRSAWIDDADLSLEVDRCGEEIFTFTATDDQFYYLLKREDIAAPQRRSSSCYQFEDKAPCSDSVREYRLPDHNGIGLPGVGHPEIFVLYRLPGQTRTKLRVAWAFGF